MRRRLAPLTHSFSFPHTGFHPLKLASSKFQGACLEAAALHGSRDTAAGRGPAAARGVRVGLGQYTPGTGRAHISDGSRREGGLDLPAPESQPARVPRRRRGPAGPPRRLSFRFEARGPAGGAGRSAMTGREEPPPFGACCCLIGGRLWHSAEGGGG